MQIDRRIFLSGLSAALVAPTGATAASVTDGAGRAVPVPARVTRVFPAGPPAAITLYTITPDLLLGWPRANRDDEREFPDEKIGALPEVGRITGRGTTANLEVVLALKPDLVLDIGIVNNTYISLADRAYLLRDGACVAEGEVKHVLTSEQLQELYGAPIERLVDATTGATAFLPG